MNMGRGPDLFAPDDDEREALLAEIAKVTDEPLHIIDRRAGESVTTLRAELARVSPLPTMRVFVVEDDRGEKKLNLEEVKIAAKETGLSVLALNEYFGQLTNILGAKEEIDLGRANALIHMFLDSRPTNPSEAELIIQRIISHYLTTNLATLPSRNKHIGAQEIAKPLVKLIDCNVKLHGELARAQRGRVEQKITVEHVNIAAGANAIVGNVKSRGALPELTKGTP